MSPSQCPVCFTPLEVRDVTACVICGGWPGQVERPYSSTDFRQWRLPGGQILVLCQACELEEFMVPGGWGFRLGLAGGRLPINALQPIPAEISPVLNKDKFCPQCNLRLAFLEVIAPS